MHLCACLHMCPHVHVLATSCLERSFDFILIMSTDVISQHSFQKTKKYPLRFQRHRVCYAEEEDEPQTELKKLAPTSSQASYKPGTDEESDLSQPVKGSKEFRKTLQAFLSEAGSTIRPKVTQDWNSLDSESQKKQLRDIVSTVRQAISTFAPNDVDQVTNEVSAKLSLKHLGDIPEDAERLYQNFAAAYREAENWQGRRQILSLFAKDMPLTLIQQYLPDVTRWQFVSARKHADQYGVGKAIPEGTCVQERFDRELIGDFVDFVLTECSIESPFGEKTAKLSSGEKISIPNMVRTMQDTEIITTYLESKKGMPTLKATSLRMILQNCR